eukprot:6417687-Amphidinium_carterae.1
MKPCEVEHRSGMEGLTTLCLLQHPPRAWLNRYGPRPDVNRHPSHYQCLMPQASGRFGLARMGGSTGLTMQNPLGTPQEQKRRTQQEHRADPEESPGLTRSVLTHMPRAVEMSGWGGNKPVRAIPNHGGLPQPLVVKEKALGAPAQQPPWWWPNAVGEERTAPGMPRAWSHQPARTQAIAPEPKKRPHSDSSKEATGCNNLHGVTVTRVDGELQ